MRQVFTFAHLGCGKSFKLMHNFQKFTFSVTEREILHGILQVENPEKSCLWFKRNIQDIENISPSNILAKFIGRYFKIILCIIFNGIAWNKQFLLFLYMFLK